MIFKAFFENRDLSPEKLPTVETIQGDLKKTRHLSYGTVVPQKIALRIYSEVVIMCWVALENNVLTQRRIRKCSSWMKDSKWLYLESKRFHERLYTKDRSSLYDVDE